MNVLLIYPPVAGLYTIHLAIPLLTAHLRSQGINVTVWDANNDFYRFFLTRERIENGRRFALEHLLKLNEKPELTANEMQTYSVLGKALSESADISDWERLLFAPIKDINSENLLKRFSAFGAALPLASAAYYPEGVQYFPTYGTVRYFSPFSPYSSAGVLESVEKEGIFSNFYEKKLAPMLSRSSHDIVGISISYADQAQAAFRCARVIKQISPQTHVTVGGTFVSGSMQNLRDTSLFTLIDSIILEDGEIPLSSLARELGRPEPDLTRVPGLIYRERETIHINPPQAPPAPETLPFPDFSDLPLDNYLVPRSALWLSVRSARGCSWARCAFCRTDIGPVCHYAKIDPDYTFEMLKTLVDQTGMRLFGMIQEASDPLMLDELSHRMIDDHFLIRWSCNLRFDKKLTLQRFRLYRKAGCHSLNFGIETYNNRLLKLLNKGITTKTIDSGLSNAFWAGIPTFAYMMVGLPTETEEEALKSYEAICKFRDDGLLSTYHYNAFVILPGSEIYRDPIKYDIQSMVFNAGEDLNPDVYSFSGSIIPPARAAMLRDRFNQIKPAETRSQRIKVGTGSYDLRHDLSKVGQ